MYKIFDDDAIKLLKFIGEGLGIIFIVVYTVLIWDFTRNVKDFIIFTFNFLIFLLIIAVVVVIVGGLLVITYFHWLACLLAIPVIIFGVGFLIEFVVKIQEGKFKN